MDDGLRWLDATAQSELVRDRELSPLELVQAAIDRLERLDPALNAVVHRTLEHACERAAPLGPGDGPFAGVPFLLKDIGAQQAGVPQTWGNVALRDARRVAREDTPLGTRFRDAGLVTLGVTNMPEFGLLADTQPLAFGPTRNPWDLRRSVGGSSGGAAAAVVSGIVPIAHATDGGGSIRNPAAWCGLVGLKTSRGRVPWPADEPDQWAVELAVSRTVRDTALLLDAVHGDLPGALYRAFPPAEPYAKAMRRDPGRLRIALLSEGPGVTVHPECVRAVEDAAALLASIGHHVDPARPGALFEEIPAEIDEAATTVSLREQLRELGQKLGRQVGEGDVEPYSWSLAKPERPSVPADLVLDHIAWHQARAVRLVRWFDEERVDLLLTPTVSEPPPELAALAALDPEAMHVTERRHFAFLEPFNASGQPAISLPLHWTPDDLPVGVQLIARTDRDDLLLQVARQLEEVAPWQDKRPPRP